MTECCLAFNSGLHGKALCKFIDECFPHGACESFSVSEASPGVVASSETLARLIFHPIDFDEVTGQLAPTAFDDVLAHDLSVIREDIASNEEIGTFIQEKINTGLSRPVPQSRKLIRVCLASVGEIRAICNASDSRLFAIYDTAMPEKPSHASVFCFNVGRENKKSKREVREIAFRIFSKGIETLDEYRSGAIG